ncbi:MAG: hypothetical protein AVDCRST_MAG88-3564, partial [uncultured Thermomicrobiales bacterium]
GRVCYRRCRDHQPSGVRRLQADGAGDARGLRGQVRRARRRGRGPGRGVAPEPPGDYRVRERGAGQGVVGLRGVPRREGVAPAALGRQPCRGRGGL